MPLLCIFEKRRHISCLPTYLPTYLRLQLSSLIHVFKTEYLGSGFFWREWILWNVLAYLPTVRVPYPSAANLAKYRIVPYELLLLAETKCEFCHHYSLSFSLSISILQTCIYHHLQVWKTTKQRDLDSASTSSSFSIDPPNIDVSNCILSKAASTTQ